MRGWDYAAIITLATVGFTLSYDALRQVAIAIHVRPSLSYLFPIVIDGFIAYGVRAIVLLRHHPFPARLYAWFLFLAGTGASLWANSLHAVTLNHGPLSGPSSLYLGDRVVGALSTLAPLALAGSVHLYTVMARTADPSVPDRSGTGPGLVWARGHGSRAERGPVAVADTWGSEPISDHCVAGDVVDGRMRRSATLGRAGTGTDLRTRAEADHPDQADRPHAVEDGSPDGSPFVPSRPDGPLGRLGTPYSDRSGGEPEVGSTVATAQPDRAEAPVPNSDESAADREVVDEWMKDLLPIAREASARAGRVSRSVVQDAVRAHQPISNERLGDLLAYLKKEAKQAPQSATAGPSGKLW
ncbi:DUF2637 domain-containing protein [Streptomyces sp. G45]|uniref:DUF2637 domain-containing protein n=1 Tax=Streptomyces sp. G45 TaxID=3406627 RepID=UPI003C22CF8D